MWIAIVEDDGDFAEKVEREVNAFFRERQGKAAVRHLEGGELLEALGRQEHYALCLLDVEMPGMNGLELAERIHALDADVRVVLLTSYEKYALGGFRAGVYYYILKDGCEEELRRILERVCREEDKKREEYYIISGEEEGCKLAVDDILYLTKEKKYTYFHCRDRAVYKERISLDSAGTRLPPDRFAVINRGIMVNMKHIRQFAHLEIVMQDGTVLPVSRRMRAQVRDKIAEYWRNIQ